MFAQRVRELMQECGGQSAMARRLSRAGAKVYPSLIGHWLAGTLPNVDKLELVADEFAVSTDWLLGRTEYREPREPSQAERALRIIERVVATPSAREMEALEAAIAAGAPLAQGFRREPEAGPDE